MWEPKILESDVLQSENYEPESSPGAGDGKGWRLSKNGDFQIGTSSCVGGEIFSPHGNVRVDSLQYELGFDPDKQRYLDEKHLRESGITPAGQHLQGHVLEPVVFLTQEQIDAAKGLDLDGQARYFGEKTRDPIIGTATGKEYLYVKQPGGQAAIGDLQKCCGRDTFTEQFLNREVRSDLKPEVACVLSMAAPMTANGKVPINNLPRPVDDDQ